MTTISRIREVNRESGFHWFDRASMRFFRSRVLPETFATPDGALFVSSEQFDDDSPRLFTVRRFVAASGDVGTVGEFQEYESRDAAYGAANRRARLEWPNEDLADAAGLRPASWLSV